MKQIILLIILITYTIIINNVLSIKQRQVLDFIIPLPSGLTNIHHGKHFSKKKIFVDTPMSNYKLHHYKVTLPNVHGYKRGGLTEGYDEDTIQVSTLFGHLHDKISKNRIVSFDYSQTLDLLELQIGDSLTVTAQHQEKHLYVMTMQYKF